MLDCGLFLISPYIKNSCEFTNLLFASSPMSAGAGLLAAALNRFLVIGIVINLAIIKDVFVAACNLNYL